MTDLLCITQLRRAAQQSRVEARIHVQIESIAQKETRDGKPYWELIVADSETKFTLRAWSDTPGYKQCCNLERGSFIEITGEFSCSANFGLEAKQWNCRGLEPEERESLLGGPEEVREKQKRDFEWIEKTVASLGDPRLRILCASFLREFGERFRRTAAARNFHHARRGGLVEHTAQMMRTAAVVAEVYPLLNRDLLIAGVLFHDCGKLWENALPDHGFTMGFDECGEMMGHIAIAVELLNKLWRTIEALPEHGGWKKLSPRSEDVRLHLIHLILSHHGELQFGSPVCPKTPEACVLHYIDNLDAKIEMITAAYGTAQALAPRIFERVRPLPANLVAPLAKFAGANNDGDGSENHSSNGSNGNGHAREFNEDQRLFNTSKADRHL
jgi:3'-5' exoribonuclease